MMKAYRTIDDVLSSPWGSTPLQEVRRDDGSDRVLRSTKLEDSIYADVRAGDDGLSQIEQAAERKLHTFPALSRDVYQSFYSLSPKRRGEEELSAAARKFNGSILDHVIQSEDFATIKAICEGRDLPAYEAAAEFIARTAEDLDGLLADLGGEKGAVNTLEKLESAQARAQEELAGLLERLRQTKEHNKLLEQKVVEAANQAESKRQQVEAVNRLIDASAVKNDEKTASRVAQAVRAAAGKAEEVRAILGAWSDEPGNMERSEVNAELLALVRKSDVLRNIAKYLGRFREISAQGKRNGYAYGCGETYSLELGSDLSRALTSELAMLADPATAPLFLKKYQRKQIKQYRRREPVYRGMGDIICCLDESTSTRGDCAAWGKAVALALLDIAADHGRKFALIHFSGSDSLQADLFLPGQYGVADKLRAAETFLSGGTNFAAPLTKAMELMENEKFENADVVFITDGECELSEGYIDLLRARQTACRFTITGVLLDKAQPGMDFSLKAFCQNIYRTSELMGEEIVRKLVTARV